MSTDTQKSMEDIMFEFILDVDEEFMNEHVTKYLKQKRRLIRELIEQKNEKMGTLKKIREIYKKHKDINYKINSEISHIKDKLSEGTLVIEIPFEARSRDAVTLSLERWGAFLKPLEDTFLDSDNLIAHLTFNFTQTKPTNIGEGKDLDSLVYVIFNVLVRVGIIVDDRYIREMYAVKHYGQPKNNIEIRLSKKQDGNDPRPAYCKDAKSSDLAWRTRDYYSHEPIKRNV